MPASKGSRSQGIAKITGPLLVGLAAFLWATDAVVRFPAIHRVDATFLVFVEHALVVLLLLPWMLYKYKKTFLSLSPSEWLSAIFCGIGGSAIATVFFTASFQFINPSVAVLIQKLQPVMVVLIAYLFLGERPARKFYIWGAVALAAGLVLSFPDLNFDFLSSSTNLHSRGIHYAFGAAVLWAASTVAGKILLKRTPPTVAIFWRFFFGLLSLIAILWLARVPLPFHALTSESTVAALLYLSLIPGLLAMLVYYMGLATTSASVTTMIELLYPIGAVILNTIFLHTPLDSVQMISGGILVLAVGVISF
jgi:DME family drug/metabolite transporter